MDRPTGRIARRTQLRVLTAAVAVASLSGVLPADGSANDVVGIVEWGRVPVLSPPDRATGQERDVATIVDPTRDRAYQVMLLRPPAADGSRDRREQQVSVFEVPSGRLLAQRRVLLPLGQNAGGPDVVYDDANGWLVFPTEPTTARAPAGAEGAKPLTEFVPIPGEYRILDVEAIERNAAPEVARLPFDVAHQYRRVVATEVLQLGGRMKVRSLLTPPVDIGGSPGREPLIVQFDVERRAIEWTLGLSMCGAGASAGSPLTTAFDGRTLYTICVIRNGLFGFVRVPLKDGRPDPESSPSAHGAVRDMTGGFGDARSERVVAIGPDGATVFDGPSRRIVGRAAIPGGPANAVALDRGYGRLYLLNDNALAGGRVERGGLQAMDIRTTPPGQFVPLSFSLAFPAVQDMHAVTMRDGGPLIVLRRAAGAEDYNEERFKASADERVRYPDGRIIKEHDEPFFRIVRDLGQEVALPSFDDADRLTSGIPEEDGRTQVTADGSASGYGLRLTGVGGPSAPLRFSEYWDVGEAAGHRAGTLPGCWLNDRELVGAVVERVRVTEAGAVAAGAGSVTDRQTIGDVGSPADRCAPTAASEVPLPEGGRDIEPSVVECVDAGDASSPGTLPGSSASVGCAASERTATATSRWSSGSADVIEIGRAAVDAVVMPDPEHGGIRTVVTASVSALRVEGVSIDLVVSRAQAWSNGRPADDRASLTRIVCGVSGPSGSVIAGCVPAAEAEPHLNRLLDGRGQVRVPPVDPRYFAGTPGGFLAGVTKPIAEELEDQLVRRDGRKEVPALELFLFSESRFFGRGEQRLQLAGVRAVAAFGVRCAAPLALSDTSKRCEEPLIDVPHPGPEPVAPPTQVVPAPPGGPLPHIDRSGEQPVMDQLPPAAASQITRLLVRSIDEGFAAAFVWLLLGAPLILASRRRVPWPPA